jgi:hypothetical protein
LPRWTSTVQIRSPAPVVSKGGIAKWLRQRSAKPLFTGSNPVAASRYAKERTQAFSPGPFFFAIFSTILVERRFLLRKTLHPQDDKVNQEKKVAIFYTNLHRLVLKGFVLTVMYFYAPLIPKISGRKELSVPSCTKQN